MRNIDRNRLDLAFKFETGYYRENVSVRDYIEWLEEKLSIVIQEQDKMNKYYQKFLPKNTGKKMLKNSKS